ncbi:hypothetical protein HYT23_01625 [Candidatus Pacearchaeota archaeon]|nr:hypothetical protein [Candidatus Pacearchaeota archaeon]
MTKTNKPNLDERLKLIDTSEELPRQAISMRASILEILSCKRVQTSVSDGAMRLLSIFPVKEKGFREIIRIPVALDYHLLLAYTIEDNFSTDLSLFIAGEHDYQWKLVGGESPYNQENFFKGGFSRPRGSVAGYFGNGCDEFIGKVRLIDLNEPIERPTIDFLKRISGIPVGGYFWSLRNKKSVKLTPKRLEGSVLREHKNYCARK